MKVKIILWIVILCIFSVSVQATNPGRIYFDEQNNNFQYIIRKGDTLYDISRLFNIDLTKLKELNSSLKPKNLEIGSKVNIKINEDLNYYVVQPGDTIWEISQKNNLTSQDIIAYNKISNPNKIIPSEVLLTPKIIKKNNSIKVMQFNKTKIGVHVSGVARVFEATLNYEVITKNGQTLNKGVTTAAIGAPSWGKYDFEVCHISNKAYYIVLFTTSARDGSRQNEIKLRL